MYVSTGRDRHVTIMSSIHSEILGAAVFYVPVLAATTEEGHILVLFFLFPSATGSPARTTG
jgi:hypothetical protein